MEATSEERRESRRREKAADDYVFAIKVGMGVVVTTAILWADQHVMWLVVGLGFCLVTIVTLRLGQLVSIGRDMRERLDSIVVKKPGRSGQDHPTKP